MKKIFTFSVSALTMFGILLGSNFVAPSTAEAVGCVGDGTVSAYHSLYGQASYSSYNGEMNFTLPLNPGVQTFDLGQVWVNSNTTECIISIDSFSISIFGVNDRPDQLISYPVVSAVRLLKVNPDATLSPIKKFNGPFPIVIDEETGEYSIDILANKAILIPVGGYTNVAIQLDLNNNLAPKNYSLTSTLTPNYSFPDMVGGEVVNEYPVLQGAPFRFDNN